MTWRLHGQAAVAAIAVLLLVNVASAAVVASCTYASDCAVVPCQVATCYNGYCKYANVPDKTYCDDYKKCTKEDKCYAGVCKGKPVECEESKGKCTYYECNEYTGYCEKKNRDNGYNCNDYNPCTYGDVCYNGVCKGTPKECPVSNDKCTYYKCNEVTGYCDKKTLADGYTCDDYNPCTYGDVCYNGVCKGTPKECPVSNDKCTYYECNEANGYCDKKTLADGYMCDDYNPCTYGDVCYNGVCKGTPKECPMSNDKCTYYKCNESNGYCDKKTLADGTLCDDYNPCTKYDKCYYGVCKGVGKCYSAAKP